MDENLTEENSPYNHLEKMDIDELISSINSEDKGVAYAVERALPAIGRLTKAVLELLQAGGRLFYIGAGTSGRLGILDASECPPTFGVSAGIVVGLIAGGDAAIRKAVEGAEDDSWQGFNDLSTHQISVKDIVVGISASGRTPYVVGAIKACREAGIKTGCIVNNSGSLVAALADWPVEVLTGPEFVTGSTRMKAGTAQKMVLNMISTAVMIKLGRVEGSQMIYLQPSNNKLKERMIRIVMDKAAVSREEAIRKLVDANYVLTRILHP